MKKKQIEEEPEDQPAVATQDISRTPSYVKGTKAFGEGKTDHDNPFPSGSHDGHIGMNPDRYNWYMGWYDAKFQHIYES